jgi:hypothetical protein
MSPVRTRILAACGADIALVAVLVALDVVARLAPHAPNVIPVAASALFAASVLRIRALALFVPFAAMGLSDLLLGVGDWRVTAAVDIAIALPALAALLPRRPGVAGLIAILLSSALTFFVATNFAVWAFSGLYAPDMGGLTECYIAALPFLQNTLAGDAFWALALFGGYRLLRSGAAPRDEPAATGG